MSYHGTIEIHAKSGPTFGYKKIKSFYGRLQKDLGDDNADIVIETILEYIKESLTPYKPSITADSISYGVDEEPQVIRNINSDTNYEDIQLDPLTITKTVRKGTFTYVVSFGKLIFEKESENVNNIHRTYSSSRNRSHSRSTRRNNSHSRSMRRNNSHSRSMRRNNSRSRSTRRNSRR